MEVLKVEHLSQSFGGLTVIEDISFSLGSAEKVALIGPNGAGKTTLLNVLSGFITPVAGRIYLLGKDVTNMSSHRRVSLGLSRSFQINTLFSHLICTQQRFVGYPRHPTYSLPNDSSNHSL